MSQFLFSNLTKSNKTIFKDRMGVFLSSVPITLSSHKEPDRDDGLCLAAHYVMSTFDETFSVPDSEVLFLDKTIDKSKANVFSQGELSLHLAEQNIDEGKLIWTKV